MLKIYIVKSMFQINRQEWEPCGDSGYACLDESEVPGEVIKLDRCSFSEAYQSIPNLQLNGVYVGKTAFRHRPYIAVNSWGIYDPRRFYAKDANTISYKQVFREKEYVTLEWITKHLSSDKAIQYFKERGMSICPINFQ